MIDTVAKAIMSWAVPVNNWDAMPEEIRERWRDAARLAIGAIREPTELMVKNGARYDSEGANDYDTVDQWHRMIDTILTPADG